MTVINYSCTPRSVKKKLVIIPKVTTITVRHYKWYGSVQHWQTLTTMTAENLLVNDSCNREAVEAIGEGLPQTDIESSFT